MYRMSLREPTGLIAVVVERPCCPRTMDVYELDLLNLAEEARARTGRLRVLVDSTAVELLPQATLTRLQDLERKLIQDANDRVAIVVSSGLCRIQLSRISPYRQIERFMSPAAAMAWLTAGDLPATAVQCRPADDADPMLLPNAGHC